MRAMDDRATPLLELVGLGHWFSRSGDDPPVLDDLFECISG